jgi:hypothetical protein
MYFAALQMFVLSRNDVFWLKDSNLNEDVNRTVGRSVIGQTINWLTRTSVTAGIVRFRDRCLCQLVVSERGCHASRALAVMVQLGLQQNTPYFSNLILAHLMPM